jgi:hypothetical protein
VSDRRAWLDEWCPECRAAPGTRCRDRHRASYSARCGPAACLHVARGWRGRRCPTCKAFGGDPSCTPSGREASQPHSARLRPGRRELVARETVWEEFERRSAMIALVPFSGRAGDGGSTGTITLSRLVGDELVDVERWSGRDELALALEGPVWDRYGQFAGHPWIWGTVTWTVADRRILIAGRRGGEAFEEALA